MRTFIYTIIIISTLSSCLLRINKNHLLPESERGNFNRNFNTNGYYYYAYVDTQFCRRFFKQDIPRKTIKPLIFRENGTIMTYGSVSAITLNDKSCLEKENTFKACHEYFLDMLKRSQPYPQEYYSIDKNTIRFQRFINLDGGVFPIPLEVVYLFEYRGKVLNDSTFILEYYVNYSNPEEKIPLNEVYKFRHLDLSKYLSD